MCSINNLSLRCCYRAAIISSFFLALYRKMGQKKKKKKREFVRRIKKNQRRHDFARVSFLRNFFWSLLRVHEHKTHRWLRYRGWWCEEEKRKKETQQEGKNCVGNAGKLARSNDTGCKNNSGFRANIFFFPRARDENNIRGFNDSTAIFFPSSLLSVLHNFWGTK